MAAKKNPEKNSQSESAPRMAWKKAEWFDGEIAKLEEAIGELRMLVKSMRDKRLRHVCMDGLTMPDQAKKVIRKFARNFVIAIRNKEDGITSRAYPEPEN
jgi:hypothetical protein